MYKITVQTLTDDEHTLYIPGNEEYTVISAVLSLSVGSVGEFTFTVPLNNPRYNEIVDHSIITVYEDNAEIWRGDIQDIKTNFDKSLNVYCLEDMAWLGEEAVAMTAITNQTYGQRFSAAIATYNTNQVAKRQFTAGQLTSVTTTNTCTWTPQYEENLLDCLRNYIADDGYIRIRRDYTGNVLTRYVDIVRLSDYGQQADQRIEFGSNLLDFVKEMDNTNFLNVIYPYGKETETPLYGEIMQRVAGTPIQNDVSIAAFGRRARSVVFEADSLSKLNSLAQSYLNRYSQPIVKLQIRAVDLGNIEAVNRIHLGDSVRIIAAPFGIDQWSYATKQELDLLNIANNEITLADSVRAHSLTSQVIEQADELEKSRTPASVLDEAKRNSLAILQGADGGIVTFQVNGDEQIIGIIIANNLDINQATKAWGWNINGLVYVHRDYPTDEWEVGIAMNMNGEIVADYITTGTMSADRVRTGLLSDQAGINYINLDTSDMRLAGNTYVSLLGADYTGNYEPALNNYPASDWNTSALREQNTGKTFYNIETKDGYIFTNVPDVALLPESAHPYVANTDEYYQINTDGIDFTKNLKITFYSSCDLEKNYDYLIFYVYIGGAIKGYLVTNTQDNPLVFPSTLVIPARDDNRIFIWWHSDSSVNRWGWKIYSIEETNDTADSFTSRDFPIVPFTQYYYGCHWVKATIETYGRNISQKVVTENMTPEEVFNALTDNGRLQGIYKENGDLFFNGTYIKSGIVNADLIKAGSMSANRVAFGTMSANRLHGGSMVVGGTNNSNGVLVSVASVSWDSFATSLLAGGVTTLAVGLIYEAVWLRVTATGKSTGDVVGQFAIGSGAWEDLRVGDTLIGAFDSESYINIRATVALSFYKGLATVKSYINNEEVRADKLIANNEGQIGNLIIDNNELYGNGNFLIRKGKRKVSSGKVLYYRRSFTPSNLYIRDSEFTVSCEFSLSKTFSNGYVHVYLQYYSGGQWHDSGNYVEINYPQANEKYNAEFDTTIYKSDTTKWAIYFLVSWEENYTLDFAIYAPNARVLSTSVDGIYGSFIGTSYGKAEFDNLDTSNLQINDVSSDDYVASTGSDITRYDSANTMLYTARWQSSSDRRIKEDIESLDVELSEQLINALVPKKFRFKNNRDKHYGMIAQDVRNLLDELGENDAHLEYSQGDLNVENQRAIEYEEFIPHIINYVKALRADVEALKNIKSKEEDK